MEGAAAGGAPSGEAPAASGEDAVVPGGAPAVVAPKKSRTIDDDLEDVIKKHGGFEYAKGKKLESARNIRQMLGRVAGVDSAASAAMQAKQEADGIKSTLAGIAKLKPSERLAALESSGIDPKLIREAVEDSILAEDEKHRAQQGMSERERRLAADLEARDGELQTFRRQQAETKAAAEQEERVQRITAIGQRLESVTVAALQRAKILPEQSPQFLHAIAERLDRNERLGLGLDEAELADVVLKEQQEQATGFLTGKSPTDLADLLEGMGPEVLRPLLEEFARRVRARVSGGSPTPAMRQVQPANSGESDADKMAFWRKR